MDLMRMELLEELYTQSLSELHDGEAQSQRILPKIAKAVSDEALRQLFTAHAGETAAQLRRLEELLARRSCGKPRKAKGISGLLAEAQDILKLQANADRHLVDAALISIGQKLEALELTGYACAHNFARLLGLHADLKPLEDSFHEEERMEERLSALAQSFSPEDLESELPAEPIVANDIV